jgi:hypothetical protein
MVAALDSLLSDDVKREANVKSRPPSIVGNAQFQIFEDTDTTELSPHGDFIPGAALGSSFRDDYTTYTGRTMGTSLLRFTAFFCC